MKLDRLAADQEEMMNRLAIRRIEINAVRRIAIDHRRTGTKSRNRIARMRNRNALANRGRKDILAIQALLPDIRGIQHQTVHHTGGGHFINERVAIRRIQVEQNAVLVHHPTQRNAHDRMGQRRQRLVLLDIFRRIDVILREEQFVYLTAIETPLTTNFHALNLALVTHAHNCTFIDAQVLGQFFQCENHTGFPGVGNPLY